MGDKRYTFPYIAIAIIVPSAFNTQVHNICPICNQEEETVLHLLFNCQFARSVYQASPIFIEICDGMSPMSIVQGWLSHPDQGIMLNLGACFIWNIWKVWNDVIFNNVQTSVQKCVSNSLQDFKMFDLHHAFNFCSSLNISQSNVAIWERPPSLFVKINIGAAFHNGRSAVAAVAMDSFGSFLGCGAVFFYSFSSTAAEGKAYRFGIQLASRLQVTKIIVEGDAPDIPKAIVGNTEEIPWCIKYTVMSIRDCAKDFIEVRFTAIPRDANSIAHDLVQCAISNNVNRWWAYNEPPSCISNSLGFSES
ncbi:uncharacterized protein LOC113278917 [Papaver somniferum]|uniref:uncharacterized protein LOC113278917 n=1 Tax=Papaver somniferum TaxID=3469 RepID=UPI000E702378|nr:uncharacterized protein LOC113278917 [Papaver somniferum]